MYTFHGNISYYIRWRRGILEHCAQKYEYLTTDHIECMIAVAYLTHQHKKATHAAVAEVTGMKKEKVSKLLKYILIYKPPYINKVSNKEGYVLDVRVKKILQKIFG